MQRHVKAKPVLLGLLSGIIAFLVLWATLLLIGEYKETIGVIPAFILVILIALAPGFVAARTADSQPYLHGGAAGLAFAICALFPMMLAGVMLKSSDSFTLIFVEFGGFGRVFGMILSSTFSGFFGAALQQGLFRN